MPRYELCYILAAQVGDDQVPAVTEQIRQFVSDFGGTEVEEENLGKKKLAYPIKKTRNGTYVAVRFTMPTSKINELEAKIRTQTATIIRHLVVNLDEHLARLEKDAVEQAKLSKRPEAGLEEEKPAVVDFEPAKPAAPAAPAPELSAEELDQQIEKALSEDLLK